MLSESIPDSVSLSVLPAKVDAFPKDSLALGHYGCVQAPWVVTLSFSKLDEVAPEAHLPPLFVEQLEERREDDAKQQHSYQQDVEKVVAHFCGSAV
jgi:hypothetical protein